MNKYLIYPMVCLLAWSSAFGANLQFYRKQILELAKTSKESEVTIPDFDPEKLSQEEILLLRKKLTAGAALDGLDFTKGPFSVTVASGRSNRMYSSFMVKEILHDTLAELKYQVKFGDDKSLNPDLSFLKIRKTKHEQYQKLVIQSLLKKGSIVQIPVGPKDPPKNEFRSGVSQLLSTFKDWFVTGLYRGKADEVDLNLVSKEVVKADTTRSEKVRMLQQHLQSAPAMKGHQGIADILGKVVAESTVDGYVQRLYFEKLAEGHVAVSLPALLSMRKGNDDLFISTQQMIIDYLARQQNLFESRKAHIANTPIRNLLGDNLSSQELATLEGLRGDADKNAKVLYREVYKEYYEGEATLGSPEEASFIERRLEAISFILPLLTEKQKSAITIHQTVALLSTAQLDYLIDLYLQLLGPEIPSSRELGVFAGNFAEYQKQRISSVSDDTEKAKLLQSFQADFKFFTEIGQEVSDFQIDLAEKQRIRAGIQQDLEFLRSKKN